MDFRLNEEQQMLQDTVARLVRGEYSFEKRLEYWHEAQIRHTRLMNGDKHHLVEQPIF